MPISNSQKKLWGPTGWYLLHQLSFYYQPKFYNIYFHIFKNLLGSILPCPLCQKHYKTYIKAHPFPSETSPHEEIIQWVLDYHNAVNQLTAQAPKDSNTPPHIAPTLVLQDLHDLYFLPDSKQIYPPINHQYITGFLKITRLYHKKNRSMKVYRNFIYHLSRVFPCLICQKKLTRRLNSPKASKKKIPRIPYIRIISRHRDNKNQIRKQKIKIQNVP